MLLLAVRPGVPSALPWPLPLVGVVVVEYADYGSTLLSNSLGAVLYRLAVPRLPVSVVLTDSLGAG